MITARHQAGVCKEKGKGANQEMAKLIINEEQKMGRIAPEIYGHFSEHLGRCIYGGIYVGEDSDIPNVNGMRTDVVEALKEIKVPVLRWPGGCFADEYHWKDGIGPKEKRKKMINTHWGGVVEDNSFGTHEYMELCRQLGCKTYINGNLGSGTVQEMSEWVEYMTFQGVSPMADLRKENGHEEPWKIDYFGVGNENWGCGGNMTPQYYANEYRRYQTYVRTYDAEKPIKKICCGANDGDDYWTKEVLETAFYHTPEHLHGFMDGLSLHYYVLPGDWGAKGSATDFTEAVWYTTLYKALRMDTLIRRHGAVMDQYDPEKKIGMIVDEWGCWYDVEPGTNPGFLYQQNTIRDALVAGVTLNIFNKHCDRVKMANLAQMVNVLQSVLLTEEEKMIKTPTYYVMHMYRHHQGAQLLESSLSGVEKVGTEECSVPKVTESVSMSEDGIITITLNNLSVEDAETIEVRLNETGYKVVESRIVSSGDIHAHNTFEEPEVVAEEEFTGVKATEYGFEVKLPANSVAEIRIAK
jgi:alpha-N-arabinofuranosidase